MSKKLRLTCKATIKHLNTRKDGPDDDKELACDLKLTAIVPAEVLMFFDDQFGYALFMEQGQVRNTMIGPIPFTHELEDYRMEIAGSAHHGVKVKKFTVSPLDGYQIDLTFSVSFKPSGTEIATLAEYLQDEIEVILEPSSGELDLEDAPSAKKAARKLNDLALRDGATIEIKDSAGAVLGSFGDKDPMYSEAVDVVLTHKKPSISFVQRNLKIGYNRAARLLEQMETNGIVSAMNSNGSREVLEHVKPAIKYRGPNGEAWSGRGLRPRWITVLLNSGSTLEALQVPA